MKNLVFAVAVLALLLVSGCSTGRSHFQSWHGPTDQIAMSRMPPDPVRNSSTYISTLGGDFVSDHRQGTDNSYSQTWDPITGQRLDVDQSTHNDTRVDFQPRVRQIITKDDPKSTAKVGTVYLGSPTSARMQTFKK